MEESVLPQSGLPQALGGATDCVRWSTTRADALIRDARMLRAPLTSRRMKRRRPHRTNLDTSWPSSTSITAWSLCSRLALKFPILFRGILFLTLLSSLVPRASRAETDYELAEVSGKVDVTHQLVWTAHFRLGPGGRFSATFPDPDSISRTTGKGGMSWKVLDWSATLQNDGKAESLRVSREGPRL